MLIKTSNLSTGGVCRGERGERGMGSEGREGRWMEGTVSDMMRQDTTYHLFRPSFPTST